MQVRISKCATETTDGRSNEITATEALGYVERIGGDWPAGLKTTVVKYFITQSRNTIDAVVKIYKDLQRRGVWSRNAGYD